MKFCRLNMDGSWWIGDGVSGLLIDPWLHGTEVDYAGWFNTQWHATPPISYDELPLWNAVLITQKYPDHFHKETLLRLKPDIVFATFRVADAVRKLLPMADVRVFSLENPQHSWKGITMTLLPTRRRIDPFYDALYIDVREHGVLFAPHGIMLDEAHWSLLHNRPACSLLLAPYNLYRLPTLLGGTVSPGLPGLRTLVNAVGPRVVCRSHDEMKHGTGLVSRLARIDDVTEEIIRNTSWLSPLHLTLTDYREVAL